MCRSVPLQQWWHFRSGWQGDSWLVPRGLGMDHNVLWIYALCPRNDGVFGAWTSFFFCVCGFFFFQYPPPPTPLYAGVMGCGDAEATDLGFVCWSDGMRWYRSDWPGLCLLEWWDAVMQKRLTWALFVCFFQPSCAASQQGWFWTVH